MTDQEIPLTAAAFEAWWTLQRAEGHATPELEHAARNAINALAMIELNEAKPVAGAVDTAKRLAMPDLQTFVKLWAEREQ